MRLSIFSALSCATLLLPLAPQVDAENPAPFVRITRASPTREAAADPNNGATHHIAAQSPDEDVSIGSDATYSSRPRRYAAFESVSASANSSGCADCAGRSSIAGSGTCSTCRSNPVDDTCDALKRANTDRSCDNVYFFFLGEAFRLRDQGTRAAGRFGLNWGLPIFNDGNGLGFQIGGSGSYAEEAPQWFVTTGVFYRGDMHCDWACNFGAAFDFAQDDELHADVAQVRGKTSITLDPKYEVGLWGSFSVLDDVNGSRTVEPVDQVNGFFSYLCDNGTIFTGWCGWRDDPSSFAIGMNTYTPITDHWAGVFGAYFAFEADTWNVYTGLIRHCGERARVDYLGQDRHQPYFPVADNTSMTLFEK
jgi:hypothetical protein